MSFCYSEIYKVVLGSSTYSIIKLGGKICFNSKSEYNTVPFSF